MIFAADSALPPSAASIISAKGDGVRLWAGYYPGPGIWQDPRHPWTHNDFIRIQESGLATLAFCSGWTDPATIKAMSTSWGIPFCVDVENGIRDDGSWLQGWLDAAEVAGLYGHGPVHRGRRAPFHVVTYFPGSNPNLTWPTRAWWPAVWGAYVAKPGTPCAWQYQRSTQAYGATIDRSWYDNEFAARFSLGSGSGGTDLDTQEHAWLESITNEVLGITQVLGIKVVPGGQSSSQRLDDIQNALKAVATPTVDNTAVLAALADLKAHPTVASDPALSTKIDALSKHLGVGTA